MYATRSDIETLYGADELRSALNLSFDAELTETDIARVDMALVESGSQIDSYIGARFSLPLPLVPDVLRSFCVDMAIYRIALRNGRPRDELRTRFEDAIKFLMSVSKGIATLPGVETDGQPAADAKDGSSADVQFISRDRTFNRKTGLMI